MAKKPRANIIARRSVPRGYGVIIELPDGTLWAGVVEFAKSVEKANRLIDTEGQ